MIATDDVLKKLTTVPSEQEAAIIVAALFDEGIDACYMGETTANFRVGVPGKVHVYVSETEYAHARGVFEAQESAADDEPSYDDDPSNTAWDVARRAAIWLILLLMLLTIG